MSDIKLNPDNVLPIWTPRDSIDTAQQFHLELHNAERLCPDCDELHPVVRVNPVRSIISQFLFSRGRHRKAKVMDAFAVACLLMVTAALGCAVLIMASPGMTR